MANRKSWRRAAGPPASRGPSRLAQKPVSAPFPGISSTALSSALHLLLAKDVTLTSVDGAVHTGLFAGTENGPDGTRLVLSCARSTPAKKDVKMLGTFVEKKGQVSRKVILPVKYVVTMNGKSAIANLGRTDALANATTVKAAFAIDGDISRATTGVGRQLKPFDDFSTVRTTDAVRATTLDEQTFGELANGRTGKKWDQFQVNEDKFGVKTSFDEHQYTTKIDTRDARFAEREREAARLASEIEAKQSDNIHIRVERNQAIAADFDEEALHSGVQRSTPQEPRKPVEAAKPAPVERPKLSYAAAAAGSVKAQMAQAQKAAALPAQSSTNKATSTARSTATATRASSTTPTTATGPSTPSEKKERETAAEKKAKSNGPRSSRENLPQLVKVRSAITGRNSPSQSRNSPLPTPAIADTSAVAVLNLDAQTPKFGPEHIKSFEEYKTNRGIQSIAENREKITDSFKKFRTKLDSRNGQLRRSSSNANGTGGTNSTAPLDKKSTEGNPRSDDKPAPAASPTHAAAAAPAPAPAPVQASGPLSAKSEELKVEQRKATQPPTSKAPETGSKPKPKLKSKLNPNAAEFKLNPDAPAFEPAVPKQPPVNPNPQPMAPYPPGAVPPEYVQAAQAGHQGYPVPVQAMGQIPFGQPYGVIMPGAVPSGMAGGNSAYQFVQAPPGAFPGQQVPGRFPQSGGMAVSFGYAQMNQPMPMVMAAAPQRIPGPYTYYGSAPYPGAQVPGGPQLGQHPQPIYATSNQQGVPAMQGGGTHAGGRGGHGHRRGGFGRRGGKQHGHHTHTVSTTTTSVNNNNNTDKGVPRPVENGVTNDLGQR